jgi:YegS/Rv2252/BmrU family lipid kinase
MTSIGVVAHREKLTQSTAADLRAALDGVGFSNVNWLEVSKGSAAEKATRRALEDGADTIIVCGGDGTVRAAAAACANTGAALAVLPAGTANLFATGLQLPTDPQQIVETIIRGDRRTLDTGVCNGMRFGVMGGTGFDAAMIAHADDHKDLLGTWAYVRAGVKEARQRQPVGAKITVDGKPFFEGDVTCVLVGNLGKLTGGIVAFPDASPTDGQLDVAVLTASGIRQWASVMVNAVRGKQDHSAHVHMGRGSKIRVRLDKKQRWELDGGSKGRARKIDFHVDPASLVLCAPATAS